LAYPYLVPTLTDREIINRHLGLFDLSGDVMRSSMRWGFQMEPGWYGIMERLCERLIPLAQDTPLQITSVKSKLGTLRVAYRGGTDEIEAVIAVAKSTAAHTCECCGAEGVLRVDCGWWSVKCAACVDLSGVDQ
jgi:hypothetical protein